MLYSIHVESEGGGFTRVHIDLPAAKEDPR